ncbi:MAG: WecB/TagA/CpsF family glycosyltransferase [Gammaproteobacteria bacterium]|nr:WecB/TagA/CpsF family glycosyltransferase [Gammaproteobacteria bacterium]
MRKTVNVLRMPTEVTSYIQTMQTIDSWQMQLTLNRTPNAKYVCVANVHMCMEAFDDPTFATILQTADMVLPDGRPIFWAQKLLGFKSAQQVHGPLLTIELLKHAQAQGITVGFYGSTQTVLDELVNKLKKDYQHLKIVCAISPPFRELTTEEDQQFSDQINQSGVQLLFVGLGCPKQERWMFEHKNKINCVMIGVGAAFDFLAGHKKMAPQWMRSLGLEWVFRLASEPRRLWKRYFKHNPRFLFYLGLQVFGRKY